MTDPGIGASGRRWAVSSSPSTVTRPRREEKGTGHVGVADLGHESERTVLTTPIKHRACRRLTADQRTLNLLHAAVRAPAERANSLLKTTVKALRRVSLCPWRIGAIAAAALVLLHHQHGRTT